MKKLFASVPMRGRTEEAIRKSMEKMKRIAEAFEGEELELIDTYMDLDIPKGSNAGLLYLAKSIELLSTADVFIGVEYASMFPGCESELKAARDYGIDYHVVQLREIVEEWDLVEI